MRLTQVVLALGILSMLAAAPAVAGPAEKMLPEDTLLFVSVDNATESWGRLKAHPLYAMWMEPDMQKFVEKPIAKFKEMMASAAVKPGEFLELIQGQMCFAVTGTREVAKGTHWLGATMILDVGSNEAKFREKIKMVEPQIFDAETLRRVEEDFRGTTIVSYLPREGEPAGEGRGIEPGVPCWFMQNGIFAVATDPEVLKGLLLRRGDEAAKGLGTNAHFKAVLGRMGGPGDFFVFANAESGWKMLEKAMSLEGGMEAQMIMTVLGQIGLREPKAIGVSNEILENGMSQKIYVLSPKPRTGLMKLIDGENTALMPPRFVPPDASSATTINIDMQGIWKETRRIMDEIQPGMTAQMDMMLAGMKEQIGIDIQADFIGSLGKSMTFYQFEPKPADPDAPFPMPQQRIVMALEVTNTQKVQQVLDILMQMAAGQLGMPPADQDYMGVKIKVLSMGPQEMAMAVAADHLIFSMTTDDLKAVIRSLGKEDVKTLVDSEAFRSAMEGLPRMRSAYTWSDPRKAIDTMAQQIQMLSMVMPDIGEWMDVTAFPAETMKKYLNVGGGVMVNEDEGVFFISRSKMQRPKEATTPKDE